MATPAEFQHEWWNGDRDVARALARAYVLEHASALAPLMGASIEELVAVVTHCRATGDEENRIIADMVLLTVHPPQQITGTVTIGSATVVAEAEAIIAEARNSK